MSGRNAVFVIPAVFAFALGGPIPVLQAQPADFGPQVLEEDLEDTGLAALPASLPPIDEAQVRDRFAAAETLFISLY